jgi:hypothetical protein
MAPHRSPRRRHHHHRYPRQLAVHQARRTTCQSWVSDKNLAQHLHYALRRQQAQYQLAEVDSFHHSDAHTIRRRWTGERFDLHACVQALFTIKLPKASSEQDQQAA